MERQELLENLKKLINTPPIISPKEYWERIRNIEEKEQAAFSAENDKLRMSQEQFHKIFDM